MKMSYCRHRDGPSRDVISDAYEAWVRDVPHEFDVPHISVAFEAGYRASTPNSEIARVEAAGRIIDIMTGGRFDWRDRLEDSDFLESSDWLTALSYADAALACAVANQPETPQP